MDGELIASGVRERHRALAPLKEERARFLKLARRPVRRVDVFFVKRIEDPIGLLPGASYSRNPRRALSG